MLFANVCAGFISSCYGECCLWRFLGCWFLLGVLCTWRVLALLVSLLCTILGLLRCASCRTCPFGRVRWGHYLCNLWEEHLKIHKVANMYFGRLFEVFYVEAIYASLSGTAQSPWLLCMYGLLESGGTSEELQAKTKLDLFFSFFGFSV